MKEYLPLGSIVVLKGGRKKLMIYGRNQIQKSTSTLFDYVSCLYPEGNMSEEYNYLFNHEDIQQVIHRGFTNLEEEGMLRILHEMMQVNADE